MDCEILHKEREIEEQEWTRTRLPDQEAPEPEQWTKPARTKRNFVVAAGRDGGPKVFAEGGQTPHRVSDEMAEANRRVKQDWKAFQAQAAALPDDWGRFPAKEERPLYQAAE